MSGVRYDDPAVAREFDNVRYEQQQHSIGPWCDRIGAWFEVGALQARVLDVGSGTGVWSEAIAERFGVDVVGVEPGAGMRTQAAARRRPGLSFVGGTADAIPLADRSVTAAWLSTVIHHFPDLDAAAGELRRVVAPKGLLLIRNWFAGRLAGNESIEHFPTTRRRMEGWRTLDDVVAVFGGHGFEAAGVESIPGPDRTYDDVLAALPHQRRTDSCLVGMDDEEWEAGLARITARRDRGESPKPFHLDLVVFH